MPSFRKTLVESGRTSSSSLVHFVQVDPGRQFGPFSVSAAMDYSCLKLGSPS